MARYITASEIASQVLLENGEFTEHKYALILGFVLRGIKALNLNTIRNIKTVVLQMNDDKTLDLPIDCVNWTKVGIKCGDVVRTMSVNNALATHLDKNECAETIPNRNNLEPFDFSEIYVNGVLQNDYPGYYFNNMPLAYRYNDLNNYGRVFGMGSGVNPTGYFKEWREENKLIFDAKVPQRYIYLEYITDGSSESGDTVVDTRASEYLIKWSNYRYAMVNGKASNFDKKQLEHEMNLDLAQLKINMAPFTANDYIQATRRNIKLSPKM